MINGANGGMVFPQQTNGITVRDVFAMNAMMGMLTFGNTQDRSGKYLATKSYEIADAMIAYRDNPDVWKDERKSSW